MECPYFIFFIIKLIALSSNKNNSNINTSKDKFLLLLTHLILLIQWN
jgi:hypothetical protein